MNRWPQSRTLRHLWGEAAILTAAFCGVLALLCALSLLFVSAALGHVLFVVGVVAATLFVSAVIVALCLA